MHELVRFRDWLSLKYSRTSIVDGVVFSLYVDDVYYLLVECGIISCEYDGRVIQLAEYGTELHRRLYELFGEELPSGQFILELNKLIEEFNLCPKPPTSSSYRFLEQESHTRFSPQYFL